jgi:ribosomal protein S18 acetylase RimI-like enzyme
MTDDRRRALDVLLATLEAGCEVVEEPWGAIAVNPEFPRIHMANFLWLRTLPPGGLDAALRRLDEVLAPYGIRDRPVYVEDMALSRRLAPEFAERGFTAKPEHVMIARGPPKLAANPAVAVRPARDQATRDDHDGIAGLIHEEAGYDHELSHQMLSLGWRRASLLGSETFVAYLEGRPAGNVGFDAVDGAGSLFEVETVPALRGRGVAVTMVLHVRRRAEAAGLAPFFLQTPVEDTTWRMYEKLGFAREGTLEGYLLARP